MIWFKTQSLNIGYDITSRREVRMEKADPVCGPTYQQDVDAIREVLQNLRRSRQPRDSPLDFPAPIINQMKGMNPFIPRLPRVCGDTRSIASSNSHP